jgi:hypothetical protein
MHYIAHLRVPGGVGPGLFMTLRAVVYPEVCADAGRGGLARGFKRRMEDRVRPETRGPALHPRAISLIKCQGTIQPGPSTCT